MKASIILSFVIFTLSLLTVPAIAHCDTMDGPVVKAAERALQTGDVNLTLIWVSEEDEAEIRDSFQRTMNVRQLSPEAKELADMYFFETLVRIHRAGEGAAYTGLKPAGSDLSPAVKAADEALDRGSPEELMELVVDAVESGIMDRFNDTLGKKDYGPDDIDDGREYVSAYFEFSHYVEGIYDAAEALADISHHQDDVEGEEDHRI